MTEDETRKIAIGERMAAAGEPDSVARHAVEDSRQRAAAGDPGAAEDQDTAPRGAGHSAAVAEDADIGAAGLSARELAGRGRAAAAGSSPPAFISTAVPDAPVGRQLAWLLGAVADVPWSGEVIEAHFNSGFLAQISPDDINSSLAPLQAPSGASLLGVLWQGPSEDPVALRAAAAFGDLKRTVAIVVDGAGLIAALGVHAVSRCGLLPAGVRPGGRSRYPGGQAAGLVPRRRGRCPVVPAGDPGPLRPGLPGADRPG